LTLSRRQGLSSVHVRIGEVAALAGVSTRAVRHYHQRGLLPEPARLANGYREYALTDVVVLARIRRLTELGLSLDEVRDALGDTRDLREILLDLDADLAEEERRLRARRARLADLLERADPYVDDAVAPDLLALLGDLGRPASPLAERERELLTLLDTVADPADRDRTVAALRAAATPEALAVNVDLQRRLDDLADADPGDPRVPALAVDLAAAVPPDLRTEVTPDAFGDAILASLAPAQAAAVREAIRLMGSS
jgi:DNA-binding transcriptional MerR regulator